MTLVSSIIDGQGSQSSGVESVTGELVDNSDPKNPIINKGASFFAASFDTVTITTNTTSPAFLGSLTLDHSDEISMTDPVTGTVRNDSGRTITMTGSINYNPNKGGGGTTILNLVSERSDDNGVTWFGNLNSRRSIEINNSGESFGTKLSLIIDWEPSQLIRFRAWINGGSLVFESSEVTAIGQVFVTPSIVWELSEI